MHEHADTRYLEEQAAKTRHLWEFSYGHGREDWPDPLTAPYEPAEDELGLPSSQVPGHRWSGWRSLTADEGYFAACSCGWRSTDTGCVSPMLIQMRDHLEAVRAIRGGRGSARTPPAPIRDEGERDASRREMRPDGRAQELHAAVDNQQRRLSQSLEHSTDLLSASEDQADRFVAALEHAAARIAPEWAKTTASVRAEEGLQRQIERSKEVRNRIIAAAAVVAAIAEELALVNQDPKTRQPRGSADHRPLAVEASASAGKVGLANATAAEQARWGQDLLDQVVNRLFRVGLGLKPAADLPQDAAMQRIADALQRLDDTIREIRDRVFAACGHDGPNPAHGPA